MKNLKTRSPFTSMAATLAALTITTLTALAVDGTWIGTTGGNWSDTTKWVGSTVAGGEGAIANLTTNFTGLPIITLDGNQTVGTVNYNDTGGNPDVVNLTLSHATSVLTLDTFAGLPDISITGTNVLILDVVVAGSEGLLIGKTSNNNDSRTYLNKPATFAGDVTIQRGRLVPQRGQQHPACRQGDFVYRRQPVDFLLERNHAGGRGFNEPRRDRPPNLQRQRLCKPVDHQCPGGKQQQLRRVARGLDGCDRG